MVKNVCIKRNSLGDCIEWKEFNGQLIPIFKKEDKECNKDLYDQWKTAVKDKKITVMPED